MRPRKYKIHKMLQLFPVNFYILSEARDSFPFLSQVLKVLNIVDVCEENDLSRNPCLALLAKMGNHPQISKSEPTTSSTCNIR